MKTLFLNSSSRQFLEKIVNILLQLFLSINGSCCNFDLSCKIVDTNKQAEKLISHEIKG